MRTRGVLALALLWAPVRIVTAAPPTPEPANLVEGTTVAVIAPATHAGRTHGASTNATAEPLRWPTREDWLKVLTLRDYNTRVVMMGTTLLGLSSGIVGTFMLLRRRSLMGDVIGHSALPGIAIAFLVMERIHPGAGKWLPGLLFGATLSGVAGMLTTLAIRRWSRVKEDAALAIVLSLFFGLGTVLLSVIQRVPSGASAGLTNFIYGQTASLRADDVRWIAAGALAVIAASCLLFKEFRLLCFDERFAATQGWPVVSLDVLLMALVVGVSVIGLQSVGALLVVAMLIIPAAAARFWTDRLWPMTVISAAFGVAMSMVGVVASAVFPRLPAGAVIVLAGTGMFAISLTCGARRGAIRRWLTQAILQRRIAEQHLLRALYEHAEAEDSVVDPREPSVPARPIASEVGATIAELVVRRAWQPAALRSLLARLVREGLIVAHEGRYSLTERGVTVARRLVRNHRLWELYLIEHADIAPSHVDRDADEIEHILEPELIAELESILAREQTVVAVPASPHAIKPLSAGAP